MQSFKGKKVLVFGLGLNQGGVGSTKFFASQGAKVRVTDLKNVRDLKPSLEQLKQFPNIGYTLGEHKKEDIDWADLIIKNPAVKPGDTYIEYALQKGKEVKMDMDIFLQNVSPSQIIGVTGSKGKSTTASLIYEILGLSLGVKVTHTWGGLNRHLRNFDNIMLAGNIGISVLEILPYIKPDTLVILELSSFQLESFDAHKISPRWAVITNIHPDHLNYYKSMEEYVSAKKIIGKYQTKTDFLFINKDDKTLNNSKFLEGLKGQIIFYSFSDLPKDFNPNLKGGHNLSNIAAAFVVGKSFSIKSNLLLKTLASFKGIPFRMELIKEWKGFKIYNDTAATNPSATLEALKALGPKNENEEPNIILICGGMNKNMNYDDLAYAIDLNAKAVYFLEGDVVDDIICAMNEKQNIEGTFNNLEKLLAKLKQDIKTRSFYFKKGDIILFSPAATSFNLFQNEFDRGRKFNTAVKKVFEEEIS